MAKRSDSRRKRTAQRKLIKRKKKMQVRLDTLPMGADLSDPAVLKRIFWRPVPNWLLADDREPTQPKRRLPHRKIQEGGLPLGIQATFLTPEDLDLLPVEEVLEAMETKRMLDELQLIREEMESYLA